MPYMRKGREILKNVNGKWKHHAWCKSIIKAKKMLNLLRGVEAGWKPTGKKGRK